MEIKILDKNFIPYISKEEIAHRIKELGNMITTDLKNKEVVFIVILNGAFMFAADLLKSVQLPCEISFVKMASYEGTSSTGNVNQLLGLDIDITNKEVVIVEDIIDTGNTIQAIKEILSRFQIKSIRLATLFFKPEACKYPISPEYVGFEIPNKFIVGYGLDYNKIGRNIPEIYQIKN